MRELVVFVYPDPYRAAEVMATLHRLHADSQSDLDGAVCITRDAHGAIDLHFAQCPAGGGAPAAFWRALIGSIVSPAPGAEAPREYRTGTAFAADVQAQLVPGSSAVLVLVRDVTRDRLVPYLSAFGGTILRSPLADETRSRDQGRDEADAEGIA